MLDQHPQAVRNLARAAGARRAQKRRPLQTRAVRNIERQRRARELRAQKSEIVRRRRARQCINNQIEIRLERVAPNPAFDLDIDGGGARDGGRFAPARVVAGAHKNRRRRPRRQRRRNPARRAARAQKQYPPTGEREAAVLPHIRDQPGAVGVARRNRAVAIDDERVGAAATRDLRALFGRESGGARLERNRHIEPAPAAREKSPRRGFEIGARKQHRVKKRNLRRARKRGENARRQTVPRVAADDGITARGRLHCAEQAAGASTRRKRAASESGSIVSASTQKTPPPDGTRSTAPASG